MTRFFSKEIEKALFSRKKDRQIQIKFLKIKEMNPKLRLKGCFSMYLNSDQLDVAAHLLKEGKLVAFPTETVYGLGACIFNEEAIQSIFRVKGRPSDNPLIAHVSDLDQIDKIAKELPKSFFLLKEAFFPGPLTVVLKKRQEVPSIVSCGLDTIALRMPSHPIAKQLISLVGEPLVAPSANLSGKPSPTTAAHVMEDFKGSIGAVVDGGKTEFGIESTVISLIQEVPVLLRPGQITQKEIEKVLGYPIQVVSSSNTQVMSPGMKYRHYAPKTPIRLFDTLEELENYMTLVSTDKKRMLLSSQALFFPGLDHYPLSAKEFYALLRLSDTLHYDEIVILLDDQVKNESGLMNRLLKASGL
jgi:L-threonylcarbamoyladenylate synthase